MLRQAQVISNGLRELLWSDAPPTAAALPLHRPAPTSFVQQGSATAVPSPETHGRNALDEGGGEAIAN